MSKIILTSLIAPMTFVFYGYFIFKLFEWVIPFERGGEAEGLFYLLAYFISVGTHVAILMTASDKGFFKEKVDDEFEI